MIRSTRLSNPDPTSPDDPFLTPQKAANHAGVSVVTIRAAYRSGALKAFQRTKNGQVSIPLSALDAWLLRPAARSTADATTPAGISTTSDLSRDEPDAV